MNRTNATFLALVLAVSWTACGPPEELPPLWEQVNPVHDLPSSPLGVEEELADLPDPPAPASVRLGRWLFYDTRLSADGTIACASCHHPENAFSELTAVSTGIGGRRGTRKAPSFINQAWTIYPHFFWDGRASSLEDQALSLIAGGDGMGMTEMLWTLENISGYAPYFEQAFGTDEITPERVAEAIADYERTRMSGSSPWDRWRVDGDESAVSDQVKLGHALFFGKAGCNQCHLGQNFTDSRFHNLGVGWNGDDGSFKDDGRFAVTQDEADRGAFKTPTLRDVTQHPPYMHDGSIATLREVVELYSVGGHPNPQLDPKIKVLALSDEEIDQIVAFLEALEGEGYQDTVPVAFPP